MFETGRAGPLEWAVAGQALAGEHVTGDGWLILEANGRLLAAVVDGLGHGPAAAEAAQLATTIIRQHPGEPLETLFELCHDALAGTRGGAMTLARIGIADGSLSWLGIGNVVAYLVRMGPTQAAVVQAAMLRGGIIGFQLPSLLLARDSTMLPGDLLLIGTDGLVSGFEDGADLSVPTGQLATGILAQCAKPSDDALIMAVRHRGPTR